MLLVIMVIAGLLAGWLLVTRRHVWGGIALVVMLASQILILADTQQHFGTTLKAQTLTEKIAPIASVKGNHLLVKKQVKQGKTQYTAYAARDPRTHKPQLILNHHKTVRVTTSAAANQVAKVTQNYRYQYRNKPLKWFFSGVTNAGQLQRQTVTYRLAANWHVLTKLQLTKLSHRLKQKATQANLKVAVTKQVTAKLKANPKLVSQKATLVKQAEQAAVGTLINQLQ